MFISNSTIQASTWGWTNNDLGSTGIPNTDNVYGEFTGYTVADDGYAYAIPLNQNATLVDKVMVLSPGTCNTRYTNYTVPSASLINAGTSGKPSFAACPNILNSKGILAPNGKIYYIRSTGYNSISAVNAAGLCILTPNNGDCTWEFYNITTQVAGSIASLILGKDGKLYIIPGGPTSTPYISRLVRLDISGSSIVEEVSAWYNNTAGTNARNPIAQSSSGTFVQLTAASSMTGVTVGKMVSVAGDNDAAGVLNQENDTFITAVDTINKTITLSEVPAVPLTNKTLAIGDFPRKPTNSLSNLVRGQYSGRLNNFFEKSYNGNDYISGINASYNTVRNPQANGGASAESGGNPLYTAFLDPNPTSNKIYLFPYSGTQIFWIDPDNWDNRLALHTAKNLTLTDLGIGRPGTAIPYGKSALYLGTAMKKIPSVALGPDDKFYASLGTWGSTVGLPTATRKFMSIDVSGKSVNYVSPSNPLNDGTSFAQSGINLLPNGNFFTFSTKTFSGQGIAYRSFQELYFKDSNNPDIYKVSGTTYGVGPYYGRKNYSGNIPGDGGGMFMGVRQPSSVTFGSDISLNGKVITPGNRLSYGLEYLSVKGFYTGVTNFNLIDAEYLDIPDDLADLPTSKYSIRNNMPL
jgi:hypothetical protein